MSLSLKSQQNVRRRLPDACGDSCMAGACGDPRRCVRGRQRGYMPGNVRQRQQNSDRAFSTDSLIAK